MLYRTILLLTIGWFLLTGIFLAILVSTSWLGTQRVEPLNRHIAYYTALSAMHQGLVQETYRPTRVDAALRRQLIARAGESERLAADSTALDAVTPERLRQVARLLNFAAVQGERPVSGAGWPGWQSLAEALALLQRGLDAELQGQRQLLQGLQEHNRQGFFAALLLAVIIPIASLFTFLFFRRRVLQPLDNLGYLMELLARKDYAAALTDHVDPLMAPLFDKYNHMVRRMHEVEVGHARREDDLQQEVDEASRAFLQQHAALARAERLAAVGDVSAHLAHDLRNPLAGVLMTLSNLRDEVESESHRERLGLALGELENISALLNRLVDAARQEPERPECLALAPVIDKLARLVRCQLNAGVILETSVPEGIRCRLPKTGFRHVLLNLLLNAAQAIGKAPGRIQLSVSPVEGEVVMRILDDGPGFPERLLREGVHDYDSWRQGGTGLGLAAAQRFAVQNRGRLELSNREQGGAEVCLRLPQEACDE